MASWILWINCAFSNFGGVFTQVITLDKIKVESKICYLMGDFNINLLNYDTHALTANFVDLLHSYSFISLIFYSHSSFILQSVRTSEKPSLLWKILYLLKWLKIKCGIYWRPRCKSLSPTVSNAIPMFKHLINLHTVCNILIHIHLLDNVMCIPDDRWGEVGRCGNGWKWRMNGSTDRMEKGKGNHLEIVWSVEGL